MLNNNAQNSFNAKAFGKLIVSGEHAVVYGAPALAIAINRFCQVSFDLVSSSSPSHFFDQFFSSIKDAQIVFDFLDFNYQQVFSASQLRLLSRKLQQRYQNFLQGKYQGNEILTSPYLLAIYAYVVFATYFSVFSAHLRDEKIDENFESNLIFRISSDIPIGCGMGSSAALIVAIGRALLTYYTDYIADRFSAKFSVETFLSLARQIEDLQHGYSSGLDIYLAYQGGGVWFAGGKCEARILPSIPLRLVNTGKRQSSTSECIAYTRTVFKKSEACLLDDFTAVTQAIDYAWQGNNLLEIQSGVRENHQLLCSIGIVPDKVKNFIAEIERRNMAAKVSGAGAIVGDNAGVVLVIGEGDIDDLVTKYGYDFLLME